ncbi:MAG TPA: hypothetical protein VFZ01_09595 [Geminicoccaceae bacterium]
MTLVEKIGQLTLGAADLVSGPRPSKVGTSAIREGRVGIVAPDLVPRLEPGLIEVFVGPSAGLSGVLRTEIRLALD